jgi:hypothetical protein
METQPKEIRRYVRFDGKIPFNQAQKYWKDYRTSENAY